jgi:FkbM family methyltransferase
MPNWESKEKIEKASEDAKSNIRHLKIYGGGGTILDLGANIGEFSIAASDLFDNVISYEAHPETFEICKKRIGQRENIKLLNQAIWHTSDEEMFVSTPENSTGATARNYKFYKSKPDWYYKRVFSKSFEEIMNESRPRVVKMDIEGSEYFVLKDVKFNIELEYLSVEFHGALSNKKKYYEFNRIVENFHEQNFEILKPNFNYEKMKNYLYFIMIFRRAK